ncbi:MAG: hypothetical protein GX259_00655 [Bacteroidales bacterium]|nr:hypothetical protein [Bacteroidales bacterium]
MKKSIVIIAVLLLAFSIDTIAQKPGKPFKGIVTYSMKYEGDLDPATLAQLPTTQSVNILGKYSKVETIVPGATFVVISNGYDSTSTMLYDIMGLGKYCVKTGKDKIAEAIEKNKPETINYIDETKTIAGYVCKKAEYITKNEFDEKETTIVYYNETIGGPELNYVGNFPGLIGFPMEYVAKNKDMNMTVTATVSEVKTKKVKLKDVNFFIPTDYKEITAEEFMQMLGGVGN